MSAVGWPVADPAVARLQILHAHLATTAAELAAAAHRRQAVGLQPQYATVAVTLALVLLVAIGVLLALAAVAAGAQAFDRTVRRLGTDAARLLAVWEVAERLGQTGTAATLRAVFAAIERVRGALVPPHNSQFLEFCRCTLI